MKHQFDKHTIAKKISFHASALLLFLVAALVIMLRMQYILLFVQNNEERLSASMTMLSQLLDTSQAADTALLGQIVKQSGADVVQILTPADISAGERIYDTYYLSDPAADTIDSALIGDAALSRKEQKSVSYELRGSKLYVTTVFCVPVRGADNTLTAVLAASNTLHCPFFSHTAGHTLSFFVVFLFICLFLLMYNQRIYAIVVKPLENLKTKAKQLTKNIDAFEFMTDTGDEIEMIYDAFELLRDRQQRLDESLDYAKEIQSRILAQEKDFTEIFRDHCVLYKPLALVSGDFYWMSQFDCGSVLVMGDCTGHGIPGALMTMMVISILDNIITEQNCHDTKNILWKLDQQLSSILNTNKPEQDPYIKHGLDIIVLFIDKQHKTIKLSSASTSLYIVKPLNSVDVVRGQRLFIGDGKIKSKEQVKCVYLKYAPKCYYYMASDGLFEQIGGTKRIPYGYTRFKSIIFDHSADGTQETMQALQDDFYKYMHKEIQRDDITVIGFRL